MKIFIVLILASLIRSCVLEAEEYVFGEGWQIEDSPLNLGGYFSSEYVKEKDTRSFGIDDAALLAYGEFDRFNFLGELESSDLYKKSFSKTTDEKFGSLHLERLYIDYFFDEEQTFRFGKFNSDVGFWNQMPINVLRDTTSTPRLVHDFFPNMTTGIRYEIQRTDQSLKRLSITLQTTETLDSGYNNFDTDRYYALGMDVDQKSTQWRFSAGTFHTRLGVNASYALAALHLQVERFDILNESIIRYDQTDDCYSYDVYAQGVWHWIPKHDFIVRLERGKTPIVKVDDRSALIGYTYRPLRNIALKAEYEKHHDSDLDRTLFSFSLLF